MLVFAACFSPIALAGGGGGHGEAESGLSPAILVGLVLGVALAYLLAHFVVERLQRRFLLATGVEYILLGGFNDDIEDARDLARFAACVPCKVNLIEYNPIDDALFRKADAQKTDDFKDVLENKFNMVVNVRRSRGEDIDAACGQLANKNKLAAGQA